MRYLLMFVGAARDDLPPDELASMYRACEEWFRRHGSAGRVTGGYHLAPPDEAVTLTRTGDGVERVRGVLTTDEHAIGGCAVLEVASEDEAVAMASEWPGRNPSFELRPIAS